MKLRWHLLVALLACSLPAMAQQYGFEFSGNLDASATPHTAAHFSMLAGDGTNFSYTTLKARGPVDGKFLYDLETGYKRKIADLTPRISLWAEGQGGVSSSSTAVSGAFSGSGSIAVKIKPQYSLIFDGGISVNPADGGIAPRVAAGVLWLPGAK